MDRPASPAARLRAWERDIINRQRNIVFPDTVLNEGRFYRNIASGKAIFTVGQKISLVVIFLYFFGATAIFMALTVGDFLATEKRRGTEAMFSVAISLLGPFFLWTFLTIKGLAGSTLRKPNRRGNRPSSRI